MNLNKNQLYSVDNNALIEPFDAHVVARDNHILNNFIDSPVEVEKPKVKTHVDFWVPPYVNTMKFVCMVMGVNYHVSMVSKVIGKGIRWERVDSGKDNK